MAPRTPQEVLTALHRLYALRLSWSDPRPKPMGWQDIGPRLEALRPQGAPRPDYAAPERRSAALSPCGRCGRGVPAHAAVCACGAHVPRSGRLPECPYCTRTHAGPCPRAPHSAPAPRYERRWVPLP